MATVSSFALGAMVRRVLAQSRKPILIASGVLVEVALLAHAVGIGVVFAAPRGSRTRGLVVNGLALGFLVTFFVAAFLKKHLIHIE